MEDAIAEAIKKSRASPSDDPTSDMAKAVLGIQREFEQPCTMQTSALKFKLSPECKKLTAGTSCTVGCADGFVGTSTTLSCPGANSYPGVSPSGLMPACKPIKPCRPFQPGDFQLTMSDLVDLSLCKLGVAAGGSCVVQCAKSFVKTFSVLQCPANNTDPERIPYGKMPSCVPVKPCAALRELGAEYDVSDCSSVDAGKTCTVRCNGGREGHAQFACKEKNADPQAQPTSVSGALSLECPVSKPCDYELPYSRAEMKKSFNAFSNWDSQISKADAGVHPSLAASFAEHDFDSNGYVDEQEARFLFTIVHWTISNCCAAAAVLHRDGKNWFVLQ
jgi:hypothetical protein